MFKMCVKSRSLKLSLIFLFKLIRFANKSRKIKYLKMCEVFFANLQFSYRQSENISIICKFFKVYV